MKNRTLRRTVGIVSGCAAALFMSPAIANAAPGDVTISPAVSGSSANVIINNDSSSLIGCNLYGLPADTPVTGATQPVFGYNNPQTLSALIQPGSSKTVALRTTTGTGPDGSTQLPDGSYDLYWGCSEIPMSEGAEQWGTLAGQTPTAEPSRLVLPGEAASTPPAAPVEPAAPVAPVEPTEQTEPPFPTCIADICLLPEVTDVIFDLWDTYATP